MASSIEYFGCHFNRVRAFSLLAYIVSTSPGLEAVTVGKVSEQLLPFFPEFRFNPRDARFLGAPVDLVVFDGLAEGRCERVVFVEVKTRGSTLTTRERLVRDAVQAGRVAWLELRVGGGS